MASNSSAISRFSARAVSQARLAILALAGSVAFASAAAADPIEVALVESLTGNQTIVLSYMSSCLRETITGGTVTVGPDGSEVQSGEVSRTRVPCDVGKAVLTRALSQIGGRTFRGGSAVIGFGPGTGMEPTCSRC